MELISAIGLIEKGLDLATRAQLWADLGAGEGLFTRALATLLPTGSTIYAVDQQATAINNIRMDKGISLIPIVQDFTEDIPALKNLDGILLANAIHYVQHKEAFLGKLKNYLKAEGRLILVEYDTEQANAWVPYPLSYNKLEKLASSLNFTYIKQLAMRGSLYRKEGIYAAMLKY